VKLSFATCGGPDQRNEPYRWRQVKFHITSDRPVTEWIFYKRDEAAISLAMQRSSRRMSFRTAPSCTMTACSSSTALRSPAPCGVVQGRHCRELNGVCGLLRLATRIRGVGNKCLAGQQDRGSPDVSPLELSLPTESLRPSVKDHRRPFRARRYRD
jgi:hypothetical protein